MTKAILATIFDLVFVASHLGGFPGCGITGESDSVLARRTLLRLDTHGQRQRREVSSIFRK